MKQLLCLIAPLLMLTACGGAVVEDYADKTPTFDIREYLNGPVDATGLFIGRDGEAEPRFTVKMKGTWHGNDGTLAEDFTYSDGHTQQRLWKLHMIDDHHFTGTAADVIGTAHGKQYGNAVNMEYVLRVPVKDTTYDLSVDDWLYRVDTHTVINRTEMHKFGLTVGELVISFHKK